MSTVIPPRSSKQSSSKRSASKQSRPGKPKQGKQAGFQAKKRRQQQRLALLGIVAVIAVVAVIVGVKAGGGGSSASLDTRSPIDPATLASVQAVTPAKMKAAAGNLALKSYPQAAGAGAPALTAGGKPELLYIGAEYCPYCAGERWAMVMALSQFGTFDGLRSVTSTPTDTVASIPTFTFYQSTYTSAYLTFRPVETQTVSGKTLETETAADMADLSAHDSSGGIPFLDIGGRWFQSGVNFDNTSMQHQSFANVAAQIAGQTSQTGGQVAATAGVLVSHLCALTGGKSLNGNAACQAFPAPVTAAPGS